MSPTRLSDRDYRASFATAATRVASATRVTATSGIASATRIAASTSGVAARVTPATFGFRFGDRAATVATAVMVPTAVRRRRFRMVVVTVLLGLVRIGVRPGVVFLTRLPTTATPRPELHRWPKVG